ncbi:MAG: MarR family transcriptional regulator [Candidatus Omnitrophica bacterium]|nr:MarR family transcriptional regulator [Candidatus Omnitrophota bacterium]
MATTKRGIAKQECLCACTCLRKAARAVTQLYDEAFRPLGYRATQVGILTALAQTGPVTLSALAEQTVTDRTTLTRNLRLLERKGLVRAEAGADRRERRIGVTAHGRDVVKAAYPAWSAVQRRMIVRLGKAQFTRMMQDLSKMVAAARVCC